MSESFSSLKESIKRVQVLCRVSPSSIAAVKCLKLKNGRYVSVLSTGSNLLHVMEGHKINCIINVGSCISKVVDYFDEREEIWVVTKDGKLWAVPVSQDKTNEQKGEFQINEQVNNEVPKTTRDHDIFAELLGDQDIPHSSGSLTHFSPISNVRKCSDDCIIFWEPGLQNVAIGTHHIITCSSNDGDIRLTVHPWTEQSYAGKKEIASNFVYQTLLPRDACNHSNNAVTSLLYVSPSEQPSSMCANSTLAQQLFSLLFHSQSGSKFPVVLAGLQSGFVRYVLVGVTNSNLETLYHLEQPVVSMFPVCLNPPLPKGVNPKTTLTGDALIILGALGKVVLISQDTLGGLLIKEYHVPGPIVSAAMSNNLNILSYSTLKEICVLPLEFKTESSSGDRNASLCPLPPSLSPTTLKIPKVLALTLRTSEERNSMICLKSDGHVLLVTTPQVADGTSTSAVPQQIKKHLGEIQEKSCQVKKLRDEIRQLDDVIKQLNKVTQVICEVLRNQESQSDPTPQTFHESCNSGILFKVGVDYEAQGTSLNPRVILRCELTNSSKFSFSRNWSLVVQVSTTQPWFNEACSIQARTSHSVSLGPASSHHISIPMEDNFPYLTPVEVSCYICFWLKELLPGFLKESVPDLAEQGFTVLVSKTELNILNFLRVQEATSVTQDCKYPVHLLRRTLKRLNGELDEIPKENNTSEFSVLSVRLSKGAVDFIQKGITGLSENKGGPSLASKSDDVESKGNLLSQETCVLQFILHASRRHLDCGNMKFSASHVVVRTPCEEVVKFQVMISQVGITGGMEGLEIRVHTSSQALGCAVHSALLKVLGPVLQRIPEQNATIPVGEMQKQLMKLKELQTELDLLRPLCHSEELIEENSTNDATIQKLISIYCDLRKMPTIIP